MEQKTICEGCGGVGQISFFKGVSRFLISCEECPECCGVGYILAADFKEKPGAKTERDQEKKGKKNHG